MRPARELGELLASVFRPAAESLPPVFLELLDRLEALDARRVPAPGSLSDRDFRREMEHAVPHLRAFARSLSRDHEEADDLVQEAMLKAWAARDRFQAGTSFRAWTFVILKNLFYSERRRAKFKGDWDDIAHPRLLAAPAQQEHRLHAQDLAAALERIAPAQREALMLVAAHGMSYEEAADVMGVAVGTVKSRVSRGREALAALVDGHRPAAPAIVELRPREDAGSARPRLPQHAPMLAAVEKGGRPYGTRPPTG